MKNFLSEVFCLKTHAIDSNNNIYINLLYAIYIYIPKRWGENLSQPIFLGFFKFFAWLKIRKILNDGSYLFLLFLTTCPVNWIKIKIIFFLIEEEEKLEKFKNKSKPFSTPLSYHKATMKDLWFPSRHRPKPPSTRKNQLMK